MNLRNLTAVLACFTALGLMSASALANPITAAVEYSTGSVGTDSRPFTLGYQFTLATTVDVNALGYWDDGKTNAHQVGIWDNGGTLLTSTTVLGSDTLVGHFRYHDITTLTLGPGFYVIAGEYLGNGDPLLVNALGVTRISGLTWNDSLQLVGSGLNFPTVNTGGGYGDNGILLATFSVGPGSVPEPVSLALVGIGLAALGFSRRRATGTQVFKLTQGSAP